MNRMTVFLISSYVLSNVANAYQAEDYLIRSILSKDTQKDLKNEELINIQKAKFDEELLKLLITTFLGNGDLESAYEVAKKAIETFKNSPYWLETYAKISIWTNRPHEAVEAYKKLAEISPSKENLENLFKISLATNNFNITSEILTKYPWLMSQLKNLNELVYIFTQSGKIEQLINILETKYREENNPSYLFHLASITYNYGDMKKALEYMKELEKNRKLNINEVNLYGNILYALKKPQEAFEIYKRNFDVLQNMDIKEENREYTEFLENLSDLGWFVKDFETAVYASEKLVSFGKGRFVDYIRLYLYYEYRKDYQKALFFAERGYEKFKDEYLLTAYINSLTILKEWKKVIKVISSIEEKKLYKNPYIVSIYAKALSKTSNSAKARSILVKALKNFFSEEILTEAVFFSIENNDQEFAKFIINKYGNYKQKLYRQFAILFSFLQNSKEALTLLRNNFDRNNLEDYLLYSDILFNYGRVEESTKIKYEIFKALENRGSEIYENNQLLEIYIKVGFDFLPLSRIQKLLEMAKTQLEPAVYEDIYHSYLLRENQHDRLKYIMNIYKKTLRPWMYLNLALWMDNRFWQEELLEKYADILPIRDRVEALRRTGQIKKAFDYGHKGLEENREDYLLYKQFRDLVFMYSSKLENTVSYTSWDNVSSIRENFLIKYYLFNGLYLSYEFIDIFNQKNSNPAYRDLANLQYHNLKLSKLFDNGFVEFGISLLNSVENNTGITFRYNRYLGNRTTGEVYAGINQLSYESLYMFYGGMKDSYSLSINHNFNNRTFLFISGIYDIYKSQDGKDIGNSKTLYTEGFYKLRVGYPDYTFRLYAQNSDFYEKNTDKGSINKISSITNPDVLPQSYSMIGAGFLFGFDNRDNYTRVFRPFFSSDIVLNSRTGLGYGFSGGFGGTVFRQDNLSTGFRYIKDFKGTTTSFWDYFLKYLLFF